MQFFKDLLYVMTCSFFSAYGITALLTYIWFLFF